MSLRIVDGGDIRSGPMVVLLYGEPGTGKTTLALSAADPLLLDFDKGVLRAPNRRGCKVVPISEWGDVSAIDKGDLEGIGTIVVDTVGTALTMLSMRIMEENPKARTRDGQLSLKGYGALKARFENWIAGVRGQGLDVVLIAHAEEMDRNGDTVYRIVAQGGSKQLVYQQSDLIGRLTIGPKGSRLLSFDPTEFAVGKNAGLPDLSIAHPLRQPGQLASIMVQARENMDGEAERQADEVDKMAKLREDLAEYTTAEQFNSVMELMKSSGSDAVEKRTLMDAAKARGMRFDREAGAFVEAAPIEEPF